MFWDILLGSDSASTRGTQLQKHVERQVEPKAGSVGCNELLQTRVHQRKEEFCLSAVTTAADIVDLAVHDSRPEKVYHDGDCA